MINSLVDWVVSLMEVLGGPGVGLAVLLENIFPPIPSEVILPLAGFTAAAGELNLFSAFLWSTLGSLVGAYLLYWLGSAIGADRLRRIADRMWLVEGADVDKSLRWFDRYGQWSVLFGRLIPGVRSLISIPAGVNRMNPWKFGLLTLLGSGLWNAVLIGLGVWLGERYELVATYIDRYSTIVYILIAIGLVVLLGQLTVRARRQR